MLTLIGLLLIAGDRLYPGDPLGFWIGWLVAAVGGFSLTPWGEWLWGRSR